MGALTRDDCERLERIAESLEVAASENVIHPDFGSRDARFLRNLAEPPSTPPVVPDDQLVPDALLAVAAAAFENEVGTPEGYEWPCGSTDEALRPAIEAVAPAIEEAAVERFVEKLRGEATIGLKIELTQAAIDHVKGAR